MLQVFFTSTRQAAGCWLRKAFSASKEPASPSKIIVSSGALTPRRAARVIRRFYVSDKSSVPAKSRSLIRAFVDQGEELVYVIVAGLLLIAAAATCGFAAFIAIQQFWGGNALEGIFSLVNDLLLVLIIMEVLRTVARFIRKRELDVDVADVVPFLVIGAISAARRILAIGAKLSLNEARHSEQSGSTFDIHASWDDFSQAMIELGVNAGLILVIAVAVLIIHRYTLGRRATSEND
jgi:uncharacterized membrane protein (DUF373 family)